MGFNSQKLAIAVFGPPGSGKGTQADRLAEVFQLVHIDTGKLIERAVYDPTRQNDPMIQRERENFETGRLTTPEWFVENIVLAEIRTHAKIGNGIVFSGSPRTMFEVERMVPELEDLYGRNHVRFFRINVRPETSIFRNIHRRICDRCGKPLMYSETGEDERTCACGGRIVTRTLDNPEVMKVRLEEYENRTRPIFEYLEDRGYRLIDIDGEPDPDTVAAQIRQSIEVEFQ